MSELEVATESSERRLRLTSTEIEELRQENRECRAEVRRLQAELDATRAQRREEASPAPRGTPAKPRAGEQSHEGARTGEAARGGINRTAYEPD